MGPMLWASRWCRKYAVRPRTMAAETNCAKRRASEMRWGSCMVVVVVGCIAVGLVMFVCGDGWVR